MHTSSGYVVTSDACRVLAPQYQTHAYRRQRNREAMQAAVKLIHDQAAVLQAMQVTTAVIPVVHRAWNYISNLTEACVQSEVAQRLVVIAPEIRAQVQASVLHGQDVHSGRLLVEQGVHIMGNAAKHQFHTAVQEINPAIARQKQRKAKSKPIAGVFAAPGVVSTGVFAAPGTEAALANVDQNIIECQSAGVFAAPASVVWNINEC